MAKAPPLQWKKPADHFLQLAGSTTAFYSALYLGEVHEFGIAETGRYDSLVFLAEKLEVSFIVRWCEASLRSVERQVFVTWKTR